MAPKGEPRGEVEATAEGKAEAAEAAEDTHLIPTIPIGESKSTTKPTCRRESKTGSITQRKEEGGRRDLTREGTTSHKKYKRNDA